MSEQTQFHCPHCGQSYQLTREQMSQYLGQTITCSVCQKPFTVTGSSPAPAQAQSVQPLNYSLPAAGSNGYAIASLVLGIISACGSLLTAVPAIIFGILGLRKARREPQVGGRGMAITGIVTGSVFTFLNVITLIIAMLLPALNAAKERANRAKCGSNLRQIGQAVMLYNIDNRAYPPSIDLLITNADLAPEVLVCPTTTDTAAPNLSQLHAGGHLSYVYLGRGMRSSDSAETVLAYEPLENHDGDGANFLYNDGHVDWISFPAAQEMIDSLEAGYNPPRFGNTSTPGGARRGRH